MASHRKPGPDLIFGIDVGTCGTGVAYVEMLEDNPNVQIFNKWTQAPNGVSTKVPTRLRYPAHDPENNAEPVSWGFSTMARSWQGTTSGDTRLVDQFKTGLVGNKETNFAALPSDETSRYYRDYLNKISSELRAHFTLTRLNNLAWEDACIYFHFSVPATWPTATVTLFKTMVASSGFAEFTDRKHRIFTAFTEPEAAATKELIQVKRNVQVGNSILTIDAGGGTVDICWLEVLRKGEEGLVQVGQIHKIQGTQHGATYIDKFFEKLIAARLGELQAQGSIEPDVWIDEVARMMCDGDRFQHTKQTFGTSSWDDDQEFRIDLTGVHVSGSSEYLDGNQMVFTWGQMRQAFDKQIQGILKELRELFYAHTEHRFAKRNDPQDTKTKHSKVDYIFLAGGLGSNTYVQDQLREYAQTADLSYLKKSVVLQIPNPQLCVCEGLVHLARHDGSGDGNAIVSHRRARISVGVVCRLDFDKPNVDKKHVKDVQKLALQEKKVVRENGRRWIVDYIQWFARQNDKVDNEGKVSYAYSFQFGPGTKADARTTSFDIATSMEMSPPCFRDANGELVQLYRTVEVDLSNVDPADKRRRDWLKGLFSADQPITVNINIVATVGMVELELEPVDSKGVPVGATATMNNALTIETPINCLQQPILKGRATKNLAKTSSQ